MISIWVNGCDGKMGQEVTKTANKSPDIFKVVGGTASSFFGGFKEGSFVAEKESKEFLDKGDLFIDFSLPSGNQLLADRILNNNLQNKSILIATTGLEKEHFNKWQVVSEKNKVLVAPNTSLGVALTYQLGSDLTKILSKRDFDIEIIESHHRHKIDSPSGTAKFLAEGITGNSDLHSVYERSGKRDPKEVGVFAMRGGSIFGEHSIRFISDDEEITISHRAFNRGLFARGSLVLGQWLFSKPVGFYHLKDISIDEFKNI